jgi:hypothetical protein
MRATTRHAAAIYPWMADRPLPTTVYVGDNIMTGEPFTWSPWDLYDTVPRLLSGPSIGVFGQKGAGKSSLMGSLGVWRFCGVFGHRGFVLDPAGGLAPVVEALGYKSIALRPGGSISLNPLTPIAGRQNQVVLALGAAEAALGRPLHSYEASGVTEALDEVNKLDREPTIPDMVHLLLQPTGEMVNTLMPPPPGDCDHFPTRDGRVRDELREVALALRQYVSGALAGLFDKPTSEGIDLQARVLHVNLHELLDSPALNAAVLFSTGFLEAAKQKARDDNTAERPVSIYDEAYRLLEESGSATYLRNRWAVARHEGENGWISCQQVSNMVGGGDDGSLIAKRGRKILGDCDTVVVGRQPHQEIPILRDELGMPQRILDQIPSLPDGVMAWRVGHDAPWQLVRHVRWGTEERLLDTDAGMTGRKAA